MYSVVEHEVKRAADELTFWAKTDVSKRFSNIYSLHSNRKVKSKEGREGGRDRGRLKSQVERGERGREGGTEVGSKAMLRERREGGMEGGRKVEESRKVDS